MCLAFTLAAIGAIFDMQTHLGEGTCPDDDKAARMPVFFFCFVFFHREMREHKHTFARPATNTATRALRNR